MATFETTIGDAKIPVSAEREGIDVAKAIEAAPFKDWCTRMAKDPKIKIGSILIQSLDMFGPRVGFIKFKADATVDGKFVPGIVFMRGGSVAILVVLKNKDDGKYYTLIVKQPRIAVGKDNLPEIPAGMLDGEGNFGGVAAKEMKEETGLAIAQTDLIDMTQLAYKDAFPGMFPTCGGSDEFNRLFLYRKEMSAAEIESMQGKLTGVIEEGEMIKLQIIPFDDLWQISPDAKALAALCLHDNLIREGEIPEW
jgi:ADP-sugar diphosphatase